ncbi:MAG: hypothetical protein ACYSX0_07085 [Planctomycetota bacterium]|jgi:hypothetical protein
MGGSMRVLLTLALMSALSALALAQDGQFRGRNGFHRHGAAGRSYVGSRNHGHMDFRRHGYRSRHGLAIYQGDAFYRAGFGGVRASPIVGGYAPSPIIGGYCRPHRYRTARAYYMRHGYYRPRYSFRARAWVDCFAPYRFGGGFGYGWGGGCGIYQSPNPYYYWNPYLRLAPAYSRFGTVFTFDDEEFTGAIQPVDADGLPQRRTEPVGNRFLVLLK